MGSESVTGGHLPVINLSDDENLKPGSDVWKSRSKNVREALEEYGCFIAKYDKIRPELRTQIFKSLKELFDLPLETKIKNKYEKPFNGYVGQLKTLPLHESLGIDDATNPVGIQSFTDLMWPVTGNDEFRSNLHSFAKIGQGLDGIVSRMIFESYGVEKYYESHSASIGYLLRVLKSKAPHSDTPNLCLVDHTDKSFTTMLYQDDINGLQVKTKNGDHWIQVDLNSNSNSNSNSNYFVVIAGDAFKAWSNGRIEAPIHKVMMKGNKDRYSLGLFGFSNGIVKVAEELIDKDHPLKYKPFDHIGLLHFFRSEQGFKSKSPLQDYCGL